jgi:hypothetical protein
VASNGAGIVPATDDVNSNRPLKIESREPSPALVPSQRSDVQADARGRACLYTIGHVELTLRSGHCNE